MTIVIVEHDAISDELLDLVAETAWWDEVDELVEVTFDRIMTPLTDEEATALLASYNLLRPW